MVDMMDLQLVQELVDLSVDQMAQLLGAESARQLVLQ